LSATLRRLHKSLVKASREFGDVESDAGFHAEVQDAGGVAAAADHSEPFATAFRLRIIDPPVGVREFTVTISETTVRR
jgi:hypothetical protein